MKHDEFIGEVQHRAELPSRGRAIRATRAVLTTLGERLQPGEAGDLAAELPLEIDYFVQDADSGQLFGYKEFVQRVSERANADPEDANFYAKVVFDVVDDATVETEFDDVTDQLPGEYDDLFELTDAEYVEAE